MTLTTDRRMSLFRWSTLPTLLLACSSLAAQNSQSNPVRVLASDAAGVTLEITPQVAFERTAAGDLLPVSSGAAIARGLHHGDPMRLEMIVPVGLAASEGNRLGVVEIEYGQPVSGRIAPVPSAETRDGISVPVYERNAAAYAAPHAQQPALFRYEGVAGDLHVGQIAVAPIDVDVTRGTVRPLRRIVVRLTYAGRSGAVGTGVVRSPALAAVVNAQQAARWSVAQERPAFQRRTARTAADRWLRIDVTEDGLTAITSDDLRAAGIDPNSIDPSRIALYGRDGSNLPEALDSAITNTLHQVPTIVESSGSGVSRILFYGVGPTIWRYASPADPAPRHYLSSYVTANSYILALGGDATRSFDQQPMPGSAAQTLTTGVAHAALEEEVYNVVGTFGAGGAGRDWFGSLFQSDGTGPVTRVFSLPMPGVDRSSPVYYRVRLANANRNSVGRFSFQQNGSSVGTPLTVGRVYSKEDIANAATTTFTGQGGAIGSDSRSMLSVSYDASAGSGYLDWYEVHYTRTLNADNDRIIFDAPVGTGIAEFRVDGFTGNDIVGFDVTDAANPVQLTPVAVGSGSYTFRAPLTSTASASRRFHIALRGAARRPTATLKTTFGDLRSRTAGADLVVIAHPSLRTSAQHYADYRNSGGEFRTMVVTTEEIYTEFSNGRVDPTAIRDFLYFAYLVWKPTHVLLFGDGTYDYRKLGTQQAQLVPPYETIDGDTYNHITSSCNEDFYVRMTNDRLPDMAIGRLPVTNDQEGEVVLRKIKTYETLRNFGLWRTNVTLVADDDFPISEGGGFTGQTEGAWRDLIPGWVESKKIYIATYPDVQGSASKKPAAEADMEAQIERGTVITNFVGHGNPNVWTHERVLEKDRFIPQLLNDTLLSYIPAATCNFGYFDDPGTTSGAEMFVTLPRGGAIGVMTATRAAYIGSNERFMRLHLSSVIDRNLATGRRATLGQALVATKMVGSNDPLNDEKYILLGDPTVRLNLPLDSVVITGVNSVDVTKDTATVGSLSEVTVTGEVRTPLNGARSDFNGTAIVSLFDADRHQLVNGGGTTTDVTYFGGRLFRGNTTVTNGKFTITFRVPKDIAFDTATGRILAYAYTATSDAAGSSKNIRVMGSDTGAAEDITGPTLRIYMDDRSFRSGDVVTPEPMLILDLNDASGINSSVSGLGHRIEAWFDGSAQSIDLTDDYLTSPTDYRSGTAQRKILALEPGLHRVRVRAWDIYNNPSEATAEFRIQESGGLRVTEVVPFPNPMTTGTNFLFRHNASSPLVVHVSIYTASGRKVRDLESRGVTDRFVRVPWDGLDTDGDRLANGVYLYRLKVSTIPTDGAESETFETIEKVAIVR